MVDYDHFIKDKSNAFQEQIMLSQKHIYNQLKFLLHLLLLHHSKLFEDQCKYD